MNIAEIIDYLTIIFLIIFSILGLFLFIALMGITRNVNKIKNQLESANEKIESFKDSMSTINKSVDIVKSVFGYSKKTKWWIFVKEELVCQMEILFTKDFFMVPL